MGLEAETDFVNNSRQASKGVEWLRAYLPVICLFCLAIVLRYYRLANNPMWLDELYGYQLVQKGIIAILLNGLRDAHPPLYYLIEWAATGFRASQNEVAWRWLPALCGALTIPLVYFNARKVSSQAAAFISAFMLAISPTHLYFSQEARAYGPLVLLAAGTPFLLLNISNNPSKKAPWIALLVLTITGLYCGYNYILIAGAQAACLIIYYYRSRLMWVYLSILAAFTLLLLPFVYIGTSLIASYSDSQPLTLAYLSGALFAGEPIRYGSYWAHTVFPMIIVPLLILGMWVILRHKSPGLLSHYYVLQLLLPFVLILLLAFLFKMRPSGKDTKQFIVLLPVIFILMSSGLTLLQEKLPPFAFYALAVLMVGVIFVGSLPGLQRYWSISKSPEGDAVLAVRELSQPGDAVVSLHYSTTAALSFYMPKANLFTSPQISGNEILFSDSILFATGLSNQPPLRNSSNKQFDKYPHIWLLTRDGYNTDITDRILQNCTVLNTWQYPPFLVSLLSGCS